jgi:hypothetical protein
MEVTSEGEEREEIRKLYGAPSLLSRRAGAQSRCSVKVNTSEVNLLRVC